MAANSSIEWTETTWNPTTGCDRISSGCDHCYALTLAKRLKAMGSPKYQTDGDPRTSGPGFGVAAHPSALRDPYTWRKPRRVFVNSMSDLFHARIPTDFVRQVFDVMVDTPQHTYQVLTKRPHRLARIASGLPFPPNVWIGTSVENAAVFDRIDSLRQVPAAVRFLSCEPLLGPLTGINLDRIGWVICGGESGPGARPMHPDWARTLRDVCVASGVPFFFKQHGDWAPAGIGVHVGVSRETEWSRHDIRPEQHWFPGHTADDQRFTHTIVEKVGKKAAGRVLDGRTWDEYPPAADLVPVGGNHHE